MKSRIEVPGDPAAETGTELLARGLAELFPSEASLELENTPDDEAASFLANLPPDIGAPVLDRLTPVTGAAVLASIGAPIGAALLGRLDLGAAAALAARLEQKKRDEILGYLTKPVAKEIQALAEYPPDSAGSLMDPLAVAFHGGTTVGSVLARLRTLQRRRVSEVFVIRQDRSLVGAVLLQDLAVAKENQPIGELLGPAPLTVQAMSSRNEVVDILAMAHASPVVVVGAQGQLLGVIRRDGLVQAAQEVASADAQAMVGAGKEERALSPPLFAVQKRLPWLIINLLTAFVAASVVGLFESTIAQFTALAVLLPVVAGQSGNTGAQALAVTMRGLALREVRVRHALTVCVKELSTALLNGVTIAGITASAVFIWSQSAGLTMVIAVSMVLSMMVAALSGAAIPLVLTVLQQDPAQSSSILLTTITDVVGFLSFLGMATLFVSYL